MELLQNDSGNDHRGKVKSKRGGPADALVKNKVV